MAIPKIIERIEKIQNGTCNLGWGHYELSPYKYLVVCGHNFYHRIKYMVVEVYENSVCVYTETAKEVFESILALGSDDYVIKKIITALKEWFPEKAVRV